VKTGLRYFLFGCVAILVPALPSSGLAGGETYQLVTPSDYGWPNCPGFVVETIGGTVTGCTPLPADVFYPGDYSSRVEGRTP